LYEYGAFSSPLLQAHSTKQIAQLFDQLINISDSLLLRVGIAKSIIERVKRFTNPKPGARQSLSIT